MRVTPLAADSMGTRSMATLVEAGGWKILIDPGVALGPKRYGLPPHPKELERKEDHWKRVKEAAKDAQILVITHYHHDHYHPHEMEIYRGKTLIIKDPKSHINRNQAKRAKAFLQNLGETTRGVMVGDGRAFNLEGVDLVFSPPVPHGKSSRLGCVIQVAVHHGGETFLFTSDVQGPLLPQQQGFILDMDPSVLYVDGPMTYMMGTRFSKEDLEAALKNLLEILSSTRVDVMILDHHLTRDRHYIEAITPVVGLGRELGKRVVSAAGYLDLEDDLLEARRRELYKEKGE